MPVMGRRCAPALRRALHSILLQDHADVELVVQDGDVDDPVSNDPGVHKLFAMLDVRHHVGRDGGIFSGANLALRAATGDICNFMCGDDLLCPGALSAVVDFFTQDRFGGPRWVYGNTVSADEVGRELGVDGAPTTYERLLRGNCLGQPSVFWNRELMDLAGVFDPRYRHAADYDLWCRFWSYVEPVYLNQKLGVFCHHAGQNTQVNAAAVEAEARRISLRHRYLGQELKRARNIFQWRQSYAGLSTAGLFRDEA